MREAAAPMLLTPHPGMLRSSAVVLDPGWVCLKRWEQLMHAPVPPDTAQVCTGNLESPGISQTQ